MKEYAVVNRLRFNKEERNRIRQLKSTLQSPTAGERCCAAMRKEKLYEAILQMRAKIAPGPDDIHPNARMFITFLDFIKQ